jgi:hypothetical protein
MPSISPGILRWDVCRTLIALDPARLFAGPVQPPGKLPTDIVLKNLNLDGSLVKISDTHKVAFRCSGRALICLP